MGGADGFVDVAVGVAVDPVVDSVLDNVSTKLLSVGALLRKCICMLIHISTNLSSSL